MEQGCREPLRGPRHGQPLIARCSDDPGGKATGKVLGVEAFIADECAPKGCYGAHPNEAIHSYISKRLFDIIGGG